MLRRCYTFPNTNFPQAKRGLSVNKLGCLVFVVILTSLASAQDEAEDLIPRYFLNYDDFYNEFALRYKAEVFTRRKEGGERKERAESLEGVVLESVSNKWKYVALRRREIASSEQPMTIEEFAFNGRLKTKAYRASQSGGTFPGIDIDDPEVVERSVLPNVHPHALCFLRDSEISGSSSSMSKNVTSFLKTKNFLSSVKEKDGATLCTWATLDPSYQVSISLMGNENPLPIKTKWFSSNPDQESKSVCTSVTKWRKISEEVFVPSEIVFSSKNGPLEREMRWEFDYLPKERFTTLVRRVDKTMHLSPGTSWWDEFSSWFTEETDQKSKSKPD